MSQQRPDGADCLFIGLLAFLLWGLSLIIIYNVGYSNGKYYGVDNMQKQAIYYQYAEYSKDHSFIWKDDLEKENFLRDLEFFKRNEKKLREMPNPLPKIDPSQPF